jgi:hypothetical protein
MTDSISEKVLRDTPGPKPRKRAAKKSEPKEAPEKSAAEKLAERDIEEGGKNAAPTAASKPKKSKYPERVVAMARAANEMRTEGKGFHIGPAQADRVLKMLVKEADGPLTEAEVLLLCGVKTRKALKDVATGKAETKPLRPIAAKVKAAHSDAYASNLRWLAALALAWIETQG